MIFVALTRPGALVLQVDYYKGKRRKCGQICENPTLISIVSMYAHNSTTGKLMLMAVFTKRCS